MPNPETDPSMEEEAGAVIRLVPWTKLRGAHNTEPKTAKTFQRYSDWLDAHDGCGKSLPLTARARENQSVTTAEELHHGLKLAAALPLAAYAVAIRIGPAISR
jgi:hypothetical protein